MQLDTTQEIRDFWNNRYQNEGYLWGKEPSAFLGETIRFLKTRKHKSVLDLGCGYGRDAIHLAKKGFKATGSDIAELGLELGKKWAEEDGVDVTFRYMDAMGLNFPNESFDAVISNRFLHLLLHSGEREKVVEEIHRVLKKGGVLSIAMRGYNDPCRMDSSKDEKDICELNFRPGHKIKFLTPEELYRLFENKFKIYHINEIIEKESADRDGNTMLLHLIAEKIS